MHDRIHYCWHQDYTITVFHPLKIPFSSGRNTETIRCLSGSRCPCLVGGRHLLKRGRGTQTVRYDQAVESRIKSQTEHELVSTFTVLQSEWCGYCQRQTDSSRSLRVTGNYSSSVSISISAPLIWMNTILFIIFGRCFCLLISKVGERDLGNGTQDSICSVLLIAAQDLLLRTVLSEIWHINGNII